jgi:hypothetical protein
MYKYFTKDIDQSSPSTYEELQISYTLDEEVVNKIIELLRERSCMPYNDWSGTIIAL